MAEVLMIVVCILLIGSLAAFMICMFSALCVGTYEIFMGKYKTQHEQILEYLREV